MPFAIGHPIPSPFHTPSSSMLYPCSYEKGHPGFRYFWYFGLPPATSGVRNIVHLIGLIEKNKAIVYALKSKIPFAKYL